jgi:hypothetical protein
VVSEQALKVVAGIDYERFRDGAKSPIAPEELPARLEQTMGLGKNSWPRCRHPADGRRVSGGRGGRKKSPAFEIRWLNLCGFCLRPGFGYPGDDFRIEQVRRVYVRRHHLCQPGAMRDRLVDLLGTPRRRIESQSADRYVTSASRVSAAARLEKNASA